MKRSLIGLAAGAALTLTAGAALADGYGYGSVKDAMPVAPQVNWSGLYFGAAVGYAIASTDRDIGGDYFSIASRNGLSNDGAQGILTIGYDRQVHQNLVLGIFADYAFGDLDRTESLFGSIGIKSELTDNWAVGARLGFVHSCCTMWYATAGYAQLDHEWEVNFGPYKFGASKTRDGYFVGGGVEQQLRDNLFLKMEYRYTDFGSDDLIKDFVETDTDMHSIRLGVNWKMDLFGGRHAAPAYEALK